MPADRRHVGAFFAVAFAIAWAAFFAAARLPEGVRVIALLAGTFAPAIAALLLTAHAEGSDGVSALLARLFEVHAPLRWYLFAAGYYAAIKLTSAVAYLGITGHWPAFGVEPWWTLPFSIVIGTPMQAGEEIGWRGYALPALARRMGVARASLVLGLLWGVWHLPLFVVPVHGNYGQSFPVFVLGSTALSVAIAWLYVHTSGSLFLTMVMHSAINQTTAMVPTRVPVPDNPFAIDTSLITCLTVAVMWSTVAYFLIRMRDESRAAAASHGGRTRDQGGRVGPGGVTSLRPQTAGRSSRWTRR
jgi:membrane protease YdiL (CAAX protease family)